MSDKEKSIILEIITARLPMLSGYYDHRRNVFVWKAGSKTAGESLGGHITFGLIRHGLHISSNIHSFRFEGPNEENLILPLDAIVTVT